MKHIKLKCTLNADLHTCTLEVIEQTHFRSIRPGYFGSTEMGGDNISFVHKGARLTSNNSKARLLWLTQLESSMYARNFKWNLFFPNNPTDPKTCTIPVSMWPEIKDAIEAYNEYFKDKEK